MAQRKTYVDAIKGIAILLVVLIHVASDQWYSTDIANSATWWPHLTYLGIGSLGVPLFFMSTGVVMLSDDRSISIEKILKHNIPRFLVTYLIACVILNICRLATLNAATPVEFLKQVLTFSFCEPFWFFLAISCIYLVLPFLKMICEQSKKKMLIYFLVLWAITMVLQMLENFPAFSFFGNYTNHLKFISFVAYYPGFLMLGHYIDKYDLPKKIKAMLYPLGLVTLIFNIVLVRYQLGAGSIGFLSYTVMDYNSPTNALVVLALFILIKELAANRGVVIRFFEKVGRATLGIYWIHLCLIVLLLETGLACFGGSLWAMIPLKSVAIYLVSFAIATLIRKIPVIGEKIS